ncbi:MAG: lactonase family protein [Acidobacteria bacterium]|nr:lactonase family protein [Acidobacteriota bacterium]
MQSIRLAALLTLAAGLALPLAAASKNYLVFVGTGSGKGIYAFRFNGATGQPGPLGLATEASSASFLAVHPGGRYLYAVSEINSFQGKRSGAVAAYKIDATAGTLQLLNKVSSGGAGPCHVSFDKTGKFVLVANYSGGSVAVLPILANGKLGEASSVIQHKGKSVDPQRQEGPHAHGIVASPDNRFVLAADLGLDQVAIYKFDAAKGTITPNAPAFGKVPDGAAFAWDAAKGSLTRLATASALPEGWSGETSGAEIHALPNGKAVYSSNRGHDSVAVFSVDPAKGVLTPIQYEPVGAKTPRNFALDPAASFLFAAGQDSNNITVFKVDAQTGKLSPTGAGLKVPNPQCIDFLALR